MPKLEVTLDFPSIKPHKIVKRETSTRTSPLDSEADQDRKPAKKPRTATTSRAGGATPSSMTPEIKEALVDHLMRLALAAMNKDQLAAEVSLHLPDSNYGMMGNS